MNIRRNRDTFNVNIDAHTTSKIFCGEELPIAFGQAARLPANTLSDCTRGSIVVVLMREHRFDHVSSVPTQHWA
jgi:hypothetical protein